jgi:hypothetical protein
MIRLPFIALFAAVVAFASQPVAAQQKFPTAAEVLAKLKEKRDRGGVEVYKFELERTGYQNGQATRSCREVYNEFQIDWSTGKLRLAGWIGCDSKPFEILKIYDGERIKTQYRDVNGKGEPLGDGSWKYGMVTGRLNSGTFQTKYWPMFFHKGAIAGLEDRYFPGHLVFELAAEKFFVNGEVIRDNRKCLSLMTFPDNPVGPMQYEYFIDPSKDYSVVGFVYYQENSPFCSLNIDVRAVKQAGRWDVSGWTLTVHGANGVPEQITKAKVTSFAEDVKIGEQNGFDVILPEGAQVARNHLELLEGSQDLKDTLYRYEVRDGRLVQIAGPAPPLWDLIRRNWHWFALGAALAGASLVGFRAHRGWRRGPFRPPNPVAE